MLVSRPIARSLAAAATAVLGALMITSAALAGPTVTVRIEGESSTLLPATSVTLNAPEPVSGCAANSVAAAINLAVGGNWDHGEANSGGGDFTQTILGETHAFTHEADTWAEWVNYKWGGGICSDLLHEGDQVLMVADHEPEPFFAPTVLPLVVNEAPPSVQAGTPFTLEVSAIHTPAGAFAETGEGTQQPQEGATVSGGGATATTGPDGKATITIASVGNVTLRASRPGDAASASLTICVHNGNDGNCGTQAGSSPATSSPSLATSTSGVAGSISHYTGPFALVANATDVIEGHVYGRAHAPRILSGSILAHDSVTSVSLELRREYRRRCFAYDGSVERFRKGRCGQGSFFKVSSSGTFSYLLPEALRPGRYVLDVRANDVAGNTTTLARGTSRIVFYVH